MSLACFAVIVIAYLGPLLTHTDQRRATPPEGALHDYSSNWLLLITLAMRDTADEAPEMQAPPARCGRTGSDAGFFV